MEVSKIVSSWGVGEHFGCMTDDLSVGDARFVYEIGGRTWDTARSTDFQVSGRCICFMCRL